MFTGLVETTGTVVSLERASAGARLRLKAKIDEPTLGESISVSGACLTLTAVHRDGFQADVSAETLGVTTLGRLTPGARVNIERAAKLDGRLGGHLVLGHVDGVGEVTAIEPVAGAQRMVVATPERLQRYLAPKGSVTIDGVSLTLNDLVAPRSFWVMLVPHTLTMCTLQDRRVGDPVNLEVDVLARYVARQLDYAGITKPAVADGRGPAEGALLDALRTGGFVD
jgi:riboflavin synthase